MRESMVSGFGHGMDPAVPWSPLSGVSEAGVANCTSLERDSAFGQKNVGGSYLEWSLLW